MNTQLDFGTTQVLEVLGAMVGVLVAIVLISRAIIRWQSRQDLASRYRDNAPLSPLRARTKYPAVDVLQYRPFGLLLGIICALTFTTVLMNWTVTGDNQSGSQMVQATEADIEVTPPQTTEPPPPPPPPPPPSVIEVPDEMVADVDESIEFMDQSIEAESVIDIPAPSAEPKQVAEVLPPPPPPRHDDADEIFKVVEEMPRFPGCEDVGGGSEQKRLCAEKALMEFIHANLAYPAQARENNIQGNVVVQFVVNKDGTIQDINVLRDIGAGCGQEVVRVVGLMNQKDLRWIPGKQRGSPVRVLFILPVRFALVTS